MEDLRGYGSNTNEPTSEWNPLLRSVYDDDVAGTRAAIASGCNVHDRSHLSFNALHLAALLNRHEIGRILLKSSVDINSVSENRGLAHDGSSALMLAAGRGHIQFVRLLLRKGVNYNLQNVHGFTALHRAVCKQQTEVVRMLLDMPNIDIQAVTSQNNTARRLADLYRDADIMEMLEEAEMR